MPVGCAPSWARTCGRRGTCYRKHPGPRGGYHHRGREGCARRRGRCPRTRPRSGGRPPSRRLPLETSRNLSNPLEPSRTWPASFRNFAIGFSKPLGTSRNLSNLAGQVREPCLSKALESSRNLSNALETSRNLSRPLETSRTWPARFESLAFRKLSKPLETETLVCVATNRCDT